MLRAYSYQILPNCGRDNHLEVMEKENVKTVSVVAKSRDSADDYFWENAKGKGWMVIGECKEHEIREGLVIA